MLANQTVEGNNRRILRTNSDSSSSIKKTKKQREDRSYRRQLRSSNTDSIENKICRQQTKPIKKQRKKRMKKMLNHPEQDITITQSIEATLHSGKSSNIILKQHLILYFRYT
jgi:hypothetical protein